MSRDIDTRVRELLAAGSKNEILEAIEKIQKEQERNSKLVEKREALIAAAADYFSAFDPELVFDADDRKMLADSIVNNLEPTLRQSLDLYKKIAAASKDAMTPKKETKTTVKRSDDEILSNYLDRLMRGF